MVRAILTFCLVLLPGAAWALDCMRPNPGREFNEIVDLGKRPIVVHGTLGREFPPHRKGRANVWIAYRLKGLAVRSTLAAQVFDRQITLRSNCIDQYCGALPVAGSGGMFLLRQQKNAQPSAVTGPCGGGIYPAPTKHQRVQMQICVNIGRCPEEAIRALGRRN